jgi:hypothetical protein
MSNTTTRANAHTNFLPPAPVRGRAPQQPKRWLTAIAISALALSPVVVVADSSPAFASSDPCTTKFPGYTAGLTTISGGAYNATTNPYKIESEENLVWVSWASSSLNTAVSPAVTRAEALAASYKQTANIDLEGCNWTPIGSGTSFSGTFDGQGLTITGLTIPGTPPGTTAPNNQGMFGQTSGANLKNIGLVNVSVTGRVHVGGLVGENKGTITNSYATGAVRGMNDVGGLVGYSTGAITNSYATGAVAGDNSVGGLVGRNLGSLAIITNSHASGAVNGLENVGGLVGLNQDGDVTNSYATGEVTGNNDVGGLVGENLGRPTAITNSYATGAVSGTGDRVGGLVGDNHDGSVTNSYATGAVAGQADVGGLVGRNFGSAGSTTFVANSYSTGAVRGTGDNVGGLVGFTSGATVTNSFWDTATSGQTTSADGTGELTTPMNTFATFTAASWPIISGWQAVDGSTPVWGICGGFSSGYPYLLWQASSDPCGTGSGSSGSSATSAGTPSGSSATSAGTPSGSSATSAGTPSGSSATSAGTPSGSSATSAGTPGIFLHITGPVGRSVAGSPVYYGADRVQVTSTYTLTLTPVGGNRPPVTMLAEGTIELNGSFATSVRLDPLAPGSYDVQFTGTHRNGATLELTSRIVVGPGGEYMLIGDNIPIIR